MRTLRLSIVGIAALALIACGSDDGGDGGGSSSSSSSSSSSGADAGAADGGSSSSGADTGSSSGSTDAGASSSGGSDAGGSSSGGSDAGGSSSGGTDAGGSSSGGTNFHDLSGPQKQAFMKNTFMPAFAAIMKKADPQKYDKIMCTHCHGPDPKANKYKMPFGIKPLDPNNMPPQGKFPVADAMYKEVVPQLAKLLGKELYDPKTGKGFGCFSCHAVKK